MAPGIDATDIRRSRQGGTRLSAVVQASRSAIAAGLAAALVIAVPAAQTPSPRVSLLSSGSRASVVIELEGADAKATAIEATDNQSVAVEIGPVHGKVANQRLQAGAASALVSEVRVRGVTQGTDGTVITIQVIAKTPVIGSVRRAQQRVYIDLERRDSPGLTTGAAVAAAPPAGPSVTTAARSAAAPAATSPSSSSPAPPPRLPVNGQAAPKAPAPIPAPATPATPPATAAAVRSAPASATPRPATAAKPAVGEPAGSAAAVLPAPRAAAGALTPTSAPMTSTPGPRTSGATAAAPPSSGPPAAMAASTRSTALTATSPKTANTGPTAAPAPPAPPGATAAPAPSAPPAAAAAAANNRALSASPAASPVANSAVRPAGTTPAADDLLSKGATLAQQSDVKGLERLKQTAVARLGEGASEVDASNDPVVMQLERLLNQARQQRLLADAQLFRSQAGSPAAVQPERASLADAALQAPTAARVPSPPPAAPPPPTGPSTSSATAGAPHAGALPRAEDPVVRRSGAGAGRSGSSAPAAPVQSDPLDAMLALVMPDIERMKETLLSWQPGYLASPGLPPQIEELNAKLRGLHPPDALATPLTGLTAALSELSSTWVPGPDGKLIPFRDDVRAVERTKTALTAFMDAAAALKLSQNR